MKCLSGDCINQAQDRKRALALVLLTCFIIALLSEVFILPFYDHVHDHKGPGGACAICTRIQNAEDLLKQLGTAFFSAGFMTLRLLFAATFIKAVFLNIPIITPVTSKIRMNN